MTHIRRLFLFVVVFILVILGTKQVHAACDPPECNGGGLGTCQDESYPPEYQCIAKCCVAPDPGGGGIPTPGPFGAPVIGYFDSASCVSLNGWAIDTATAQKNHSIWVHIIGGGNYWSTITDVYRADVNTAYGVTGSHGFSFTTPDLLKDGVAHNIHVYGMRVSDGAAFELTNSPITITCALPTPTPTPLPCTNNLSSSCAFSGASVDLSWNAITGASGYMVRLNRAPLSVWGGCPAAGCDPNDIAPVVNTNSGTFTITPDTDYQFKIQGTKPGESYPFSGCITPFTSGSVSLPMT